MYTNNYDYQCVNVIKIILQNSEGKILLIQEPENNNWMPLHWGFPGGKPTEKESLTETLTRKIKGDIGQEIDIKGIYKIEEVIMDGRTVFMYIVVATCSSNQVSGEAKEFKWVSKEEVEQMQIKDFTEYYNKNLLLEYFNNPNKIIPLTIFNTQESYKMTEDPIYKEWFDSGKKLI